jgi:hypothetical protein
MIFSVQGNTWHMSLGIREEKGDVRICEWSATRLFTRNSSQFHKSIRFDTLTEISLEVGIFPSDVYRVGVCVQRP